MVVSMSGKQHRKGLQQIGEAARSVLGRLEEHTGRPTVEKTAQIQRIQPTASAGRGAGEPTVSSASPASSLGDE